MPNKIEPINLLRNMMLITMKKKMNPMTIQIFINIISPRECSSTVV
jgi:hypothetical protein